MSIGGIAIREKNWKIDFIDRRVDDLNHLYKEAIENADSSIKVENKIIPVVSLHYLIAFTMVSGEPKDDFDVKSLLNVPSIEYRKLRELIKRHFSAASANRLDYYAQEVGLLPPKKTIQSRVGR